MKFLHKILGFCFFFCLLMFLGANVITVNAQEQHVYDDAGVLSSDEISTLENEILTLQNAGSDLNIKCSVDFYILTTNDLGGISFRQYMEDFYAKQNINDCVLLLICFEADNRVSEIQGYGKAKEYLNSTRINKIFDKMESYLRSADYYDGCITYLTQSKHFLNKNPNKDGVFHQIWFQLILSFIIGGCVMGTLAYNSGGKITVSQSTYLDTKNSKLLAKRDRYIRTSVTKTKRPENNSSNNSSGGSSHSSGGGRSF